MERPAFYAARPGSRLRDWWTVLHPPYTAWHLAYVVIGACLVAHPSLSVLGASLLAFLLAVGVAAHALDELHGRPLRTSIGSRELAVASAASLAIATAIGAAGVEHVGLVLIPFIAAGVLLVLAYNLELFGGAMHNDVVFALAWGAFPVLVAYVAQARTLRPAALLAAAAAFALSAAQRALSTQARLVRRNAKAVEGVLELADGETRAIDAGFLLRPLERALQALSWAAVAFAAALAVDRMA